MLLSFSLVQFSRGVTTIKTMCLIIHKPKGARIPVDVLQRAMIKNPDGFGLTYVDNGKTFRTLSYKRVLNLVDTDRELVCHFRFATVGKVNISNCHPFEVDDKTVIYSNGTVKGYGDQKTSDINYIASKVLPRMRRRDWISFLELTETRFAIIDIYPHVKGVTRVGQWHKVDGIYYSKDDCFMYDKVAVYGTLKHGFSNCHLLEGANFKGNAKTKDRYPLLVDGLPYLYDCKDRGHHVELEVYDVTKEILRDLDALEGHPTFYKRKKIDVKMQDWSTQSVWVYFINRDLPSHVTKYDMKEYYEGTLADGFYTTSYSGNYYR
jgi:gamma-glutamylaminecyclotransferase